MFYVLDITVILELYKQELEMTESCLIAFLFFFSNVKVIHLPRENHLHFLIKCNQSAFAGNLV